MNTNQKKIALVSFVFIFIIVFGIAYWVHNQHYPSTDDAYVQANVVHIAAEVSGPVTEIAVKDHDQVKTGQLLFVIDPQPFQAAVNQAQAQLALMIQKVDTEKAEVSAARASLQQAQAQQEDTAQETKRTLALVAKGFMSQSDSDKAKANLKVAIANTEAAKQKLQQAISTLGQVGEHNADIENAQAALQAAELNLKHTRVYATADGQIDSFKLRVGSMITAQQDLFYLVENTEWWVDANYKETQLKRIRVGQKAEIYIDLYPDRVFHGYVQGLSEGSGAVFSLLPAENATGNWVKVTQRFPVKIAITDLDPALPLRVGASAIVTVDTR